MKSEENEESGGDAHGDDEDYDRASGSLPPTLSSSSSRCIDIRKQLEKRNITSRAYMPQCTNGGECETNNGPCWCVDVSGNVLNMTRTPSRNPTKCHDRGKPVYLTKAK